MTTLRLLAAVALPAFLASCSSASTPSASEDPTEDSTPVASASASSDDGRDALEAAVRAYSSAYLSGSGADAYALLSSRCQQRTDKNYFLGLTLAAKEAYGDIPVKTFKVDDLSGDLARVTYTYAVPALTQTREPWVRESGQWHEDDC